MCHVSPVRCHVSRVTCHLSQNQMEKMVELVGGWSVINGAYPVWFLLKINSSNVFPINRLNTIHNCFL